MMKNINFQKKNVLAQECNGEIDRERMNSNNNNNNNKKNVDEQIDEVIKRTCTERNTHINIHKQFAKTLFYQLEIVRSLSLSQFT